jgi:hypothetical protein
MKQTAVDWLVKEMVATDWWYLSQSMKEDIIEQAKEMEKQQIVDAIVNTIVGSNEAYDKVYPELIYVSEQYYNETYESNT